MSAPRKQSKTIGAGCQVQSLRNFLSGMVAASILMFPGTAQSAEKPPNIVMFAVDDMNDWIAPMGQRQAVTPNLDRLASMGVTFHNAHAAGSFCAPSRSALFTGRFASTTGCYTTQVFFHDHPDIKPLQKVFNEGGYATYGGGKLFHHPAGYVDLRGWDEFFVRSPGQRTRGWPLDSWRVDEPILPQPYPNSIFNRDQKPADQFFMEWGEVLNENEGKMADTIRTEWASKHLRRKHARPFFLAVGLYAPHFPLYVPAKYFALYDREKIEPPPYKDDDLDDLPPQIRRAKQARSAHHKRLESLGAVKDAIHGYLASISYADAMLGRVLDAIESGPNADNTIIVFWSDHGYHLGEKSDWGKHNLWERTSNIPFIWAGPGIAKAADVHATVSLIDVFPTLVGMAGIPDEQRREGSSLAQMLADPALAKDRDVLFPGLKPEEYAIINSEWRYIHYANGNEELYHVRDDPHEWHNLAGRSGFGKVKEKLRRSAPSSFAAPGPEVHELRLVMEDERFHWMRKPTRDNEPGKPGRKR
jgi:arylsulfatase A-like enzyme